MPDEREPLENDDDLTESARRLSEALDRPLPGVSPEMAEGANDNLDDLELSDVKLRVGFGWDAYPDESPVGRIGGQVRKFRRHRFGFGTPPLKGAMFNDDDGCMRGCFYPLGCLGFFLVGLLLVIVAVIFWLDGDGGSDSLVSGSVTEVTASASPSPSPSPEASPSAEATSSASASPTTVPTEAPTEVPTQVATATAAPTSTGPITLTGESATDHPPFVRPYSIIGASVLLACLYGSPSEVAGALVFILFSGAGLGDTELSGRFDANGEVMIEAPIRAFGPFQWTATGGEAADGTPLQFVGGDSGEVGPAENPNNCGS